LGISQNVLTPLDHWSEGSVFPAQANRQTLCLKRAVRAARITPIQSVFRSLTKQQGLPMSRNAPGATANNQSSPQTILAVEDDENIGDVLVQLLEQETPYQVLCVPDAEQALEVVSSITPSLFILDYQLPGIDGLELSDRLHAIQEFATIPTLMISANPPSGKAMRQRHIMLFEKPFDLADLLETIENLLPQQEE